MRTVEKLITLRCRLCNRNFAYWKSDALCPSFSQEPILCPIDILYAPAMHDNIVALENSVIVALKNSVLISNFSVKTVQKIV